MSDPKRLDLTAQVEHLKAMAERRVPPPSPVHAVPRPATLEEMLEQDEYRRRSQWSAWCERVPFRFQKARPSDLKDESKETRAQLTDWAEEPGGRNLLFIGPVGTGKTHAAVAAAGVRYFIHGDRVTFWPVVELLDALRPGGDDEPNDAMQSAINARLLLLDDLGAEKPSEWTAERLYAIVNRRWMDGAATIATSNLPATQKSAPKDYDGPTLDEALGPRMFSRLVGSGAVIVRLSGPDRRR